MAHPLPRYALTVVCYKELLYRSGSAVGLQALLVSAAPIGTVHPHTWCGCCCALVGFGFRKHSESFAGEMDIHSWHRAGSTILDRPGPSTIGRVNQRRFWDYCLKLAPCSACCAGCSSGLARLDVGVGVQGGGEDAGCARPLAQGVRVL